MPSLSRFDVCGKCPKRAAGEACVGNKESSGRDGEFLCRDCGCYCWHDQHCIYCGGLVAGCVYKVEARHKRFPENERAASSEN